MKIMTFLFMLVLVGQTARAAFPDKEKKLLADLVEINSGSQNIEGLETARKRLIPEFGALGLKSTVIDVGGGHKVVSFVHPEGKPKIILVGHIDTVFNIDSPFQKFSEEGDYFRGPGVNDMKGGIVLMLMALNELKGTDYLKSIQVVLNDDEEIGSPYSAMTLKEITKGVPYGLVYEPTIATIDHVTTTQSGVNWIEIKVKGRASHAGAEHEKGTNACVELSHKIIQISKLTDYKKKLTVNAGVIQGGTKPNVVCEEASVKIDIRYVEESDLKEIRRKIDRIMKHSTVYNPIYKSGTTSTLVELARISSLPAKSTQFLYDKGALVAKRLGFTLKREHIGGASDANQLAPTGMQLLVGLGPYGKGAHSIDEVVSIESFEKRKTFSVELIKEVLK